MRLYKTAFYFPDDAEDMPSGLSWHSSANAASKHRTSLKVWDRKSDPVSTPVEVLQGRGELLKLLNSLCKQAKIGSSEG